MHITLIAGARPNFMKVAPIIKAIKAFNGERLAVNDYRDAKQVAWCERLTDWTVIAKEILHGRMKMRDVCASYKIKHESAVWSWRDPLPAIMYILLSPILYVKRH